MTISGCYDENAFSPDDDEIVEDPAEIAKVIPVSTLTEDQLKIQSYVKALPVIAHRGTTDYAPQGTEAAYRFVRYIGSDYLQVDLQISQDGFLVAFNSNLDSENSNINKVFPEMGNSVPVNFLTLEQLKKIDVGSWFNDTTSTYDRDGFEGLQILTLEEVINICEGLLPNGQPDPEDLGNRPGVYIRTYDPWLNPGSEEKLKSELTRLGWYADDLNNLKPITIIPEKVDVANTKGRVFLATMQRMSLLKLEEVFNGTLPLSFWLFYTRIDVESAEEYAESINYGIDHGAQFISPSASEDATRDLLKVWQSNLIRRTNARIHAFTIDTKARMGRYTYNDLSVSEGNIYQLEYDLTDGFITNRTQYALYFYGRHYLGEKIVPGPPFYSTPDIQEVFEILGY